MLPCPRWPSRVLLVVLFAALVSNGSLRAPSASAQSAARTYGSASASVESRPCSEESSSRSTEGTVSTSVAFYNQTSEALSIYWLNYDGQRVFYAALPAGENYEQQTYVSHPWLILTPSGQCLGIYLPASSPERVDLTP